MSLFTKYPVINYPLVDENNQVYGHTITDITTRIRINMSQSEFDKMTYNYKIVDGETPEAISYKLYGTPQYHWTILHVNDIFDYLNDWCRSEAHLQTFCAAKYGDAIDAVKYYVKEDGSYINADLPVYLDITDMKIKPYTTEYLNSLQTITNYDYETTLNEQKRVIRVLHGEFVSDYIRQFNAKLKKVFP